MYIIKQTIFIFFFLFIGLTGQSSSLFPANDSPDNDPTIIIHDTVASPGILMIRVDALDFTGDNGQVSAITLRIDIDTLLIDFIAIQNMTLVGGWIGNYNVFQDEISITYTAPFGTGYDIDGSLLDIKLQYMGGFPADLNFKSNCEISNVNLQTIQNVIYENGTISQVSPVGTVSQDTILTEYGQQFQMPVVMEGPGYDMVNQIDLRIAYDTTQLSYTGITESILSGLTVIDTNSILKIDWEDTISTINLTGPDTVFYMNFEFIGDTNTFISFLPGSTVLVVDTIVASEFNNGLVKALFPVILINNPDTAGISTGDGLYTIGDTVTVTAIPASGFHFANWTEDGNIMSTDSVYIFVKTSGIDTLFANYLANSYSLYLVASPLAGGVLTGEGNYLYGQTVTVLATASVGYEFQNWSFGNDPVSTNPVYTFTMPFNNLELIANFALEVYTVTAIPNNPLYGTAEGGGEFYYGETATLIATTFNGYKFVAWTEQGQLLSEDPVYSFTVTSGHSIIANFQDYSECSAPVGLYGLGLNETTALLNWIPSGDETSWDLIWGETGFDTVSGGNLVEGITVTEYLLENLDQGTVYDFYVRAVCNGILNSSWSDVHTFTTWYVGISNNVVNQLVIYPNPASSKIKVKNLPKKEYGVSTYRIINLLGQEKASGTINNHDDFELNLLSYLPGMYIMHITIGTNQTSLPFIKR
ncbi:MAG: T9SS type A sorting domain-containing protein [Bacteroidetes bacterium]|nr:T9SS type A sorting domain-containing protein [Bacteroidota bacterium]